MKKPNRINPMRDSLHRLALAGSPARIASSLAALAFAATLARSQVISGGDFQLYKPDSTTVTAAFTDGWGVAWEGASPNDMLVNADGSGLLTYSDSTTGTTADLLQWTKTRGGANILPNGPGGSHALNAFATWGGHTQVETVGSLHTVALGQTITITAMVGGGVGGPMGGDLTFGLYDTTLGVPIVASSLVNVNPADNADFQMISRTYGPTALAGHIGSSTKIVLGAELTNPFGGAIIFDDVTLTTSVPDTTAPTLTSIVDNKSGGPIVINEPVTYTVTFSESMAAATVEAADFANTSLTAMTVDSVTPTANPAIFTVVAKPLEAGTLRLQVMLGATLTDLEGNLLDADPAISDDTTIVVDDTPPATTTITVVSSGSPTTYGQNVTFTATVSPTPSGGTVQFWNGESFLESSDPVTVNTSTGEATISTTGLDVGAHEITAVYSGNYAFATSITDAPPLSQVVGKAPLTVTATDLIRPINTANPDPFIYQITGYQNGENLATSGVTGTPLLTTTAVLSSPIGAYPITCAVGDLAAANYSFTPVNGTLTVAELVDTFSVNFYAPGVTSVEHETNNLLVPANLPAGFGEFFTVGWTNVDAPFGLPEPRLPQTLTSNMGSAANFIFKNMRNGWVYNGERTTLLGDGNGNMMDGHVNSTLDPGDGSEKFDMEMTDIPFAKYDVIFYLGANEEQFGDGTGVIVFNGGSERAFKLAPGRFDGTFTEMVDATTEGNYIVFRGVTGSSFTTQTWGAGDNGFNHIGPFGFQIRKSSAASGFATWADANNATGQTPDQDHDNDGVDNGVEYFMGQTGSSFTANPSLNASNAISWPASATYAGTYEVQTSPDLATWTNVDPRPVAVDGTLSYTLPTGLGKQFVRLLVTPTP
jgi:hypothetical protein